MPADPPPAKTQTTADTIGLLQRNWQAEAEAARIYRDLAAREPHEKRQAILLRMAEAEERHAQRWADKLRDLGSAPAPPPDGLLKRVCRWLQRGTGLEAAIARQEAAEDRHATEYGAQQQSLAKTDADVAQILNEVKVEERAHARALQAMVPQLGPATVLETLMRRERWHGRGGGWVADAIYGVNDGLGAVFGIVSGVAGATENAQQTVLIAGLAGMIASALSMGAGAYLAVKSEREVHEAEIAREKQEVEEKPEEEQEELALFYQLQGFDEAEAKRMAEKVAADPDQMVRILAQNELGLSEEHFRKPVVSAVSAALSTAIGAFIPIVPFFFLTGLTAVVASFAVSIVAHFAVGAAKVLITNRAWWASGLEMTIVGVLEAAVTYGLGLAFHVAA